MREFFVIAEEELVTGFRLAGVDGAVATDRGSAIKAFCEVTGYERRDLDGRYDPEAAYAVPELRGVKVLILTEGVADLISGEVAEWELTGSYPLVVEIPGLDGRREGRKGIVDAIREAIGIQL